MFLYYKERGKDNQYSAFIYFYCLSFSALEETGFTALSNPFAGPLVDCARNSRNLE